MKRASGDNKSIPISKQLFQKLCVCCPALLWRRVLPPPPFVDPNFPPTPLFTCPVLYHTCFSVSPSCAPFFLVPCACCRRGPCFRSLILPRWALFRPELESRNGVAMQKQVRTDPSQRKCTSPARVLGCGVPAVRKETMLRSEEGPFS